MATPKKKKWWLREHAGVKHSRNARKPTRTPPGSLDRIEIYRRRVEMNLPVDHPNDLRYTPQEMEYRPPVDLQIIHSTEGEWEYFSQLRVPEE